MRDKLSLVLLLQPKGNYNMKNTRHATVHKLAHKIKTNFPSYSEALKEAWEITKLGKQAKQAKTELPICNKKLKNLQVTLFANTQLFM